MRIVRAETRGDRGTARLPYDSSSDDGDDTHSRAPRARSTPRDRRPPWTPRSAAISWSGGSASSTTGRCVRGCRARGGGEEPRGDAEASYLPGSIVVVGEGPERLALQKRFPRRISSGLRFGEDSRAHLRKRRRVRVSISHRHLRHRAAGGDGLRSCRSPPLPVVRPARRRRRQRRGGAERGPAVRPASRRSASRAKKALAHARKFTWRRERAPVPVRISPRAARSGWPRNRFSQMHGPSRTHVRASMTGRNPRRA